MTPHTVAHAVGGTLASLGADTVFGLVGSGNFVATNALVAGGARFVAARHEGGAVAMADGWARTTGRPGVVTVHQGPGVTNTLTALAEAAKARTPLVVLAGDTPARALRSNFRIDQHDLVRSVGALPELLHAPETAAADAARALRRAQLERRPVVLMMPIDLQAAPAPASEVAAVPLPAPPAPDPAAIARAADLLAAAERPAIVAGRGAVLAGARDAAEALGDRTGALLATSAMAHGLFSGLPYALGIAGGFASPLAAELLAGSDVVVALGATLNHWTTRHGALLAAGARLVQVDVEPAAIGAHQPADGGRRRRRGGERPGADGGARRARAPGHGPPHARRWRRRSPRAAGATSPTRRRRARWTRARWPSPSTTSSRPTARSPSTPAPSRAGPACTSASPTRARGCSATPSSPSGSPSAPRSARPSRGPIASPSRRSATAGCSSPSPSSTPPPGSACRSWWSCGTTPPTAPRSTTSGRWGRSWTPSASRTPTWPPSPAPPASRRSPSAPWTTSSPWRAWAADPAGPLLVDAKVDPTVHGAWLAEAFRGG